MVSWILVVHVLGIVLWVGGLLATTIVLSLHIQEKGSESRESLARAERMFLRGMADPGALFTILAGIVLIVNNRSYYLHARWLHIKLVFVLILIGLHGFLGVRSKAYANGRIALQRGQVTFLMAAIALIFLAILIAALPGEVFLT